MYICCCSGKTENEIVNAIENGCHSIDLLRQELDITNGCGCCTELVKQLLENKHDK